MDLDPASLHRIIPVNGSPEIPSASLVSEREPALNGLSGSVEDRFDIDEELLEVFAIEADELISGIESNLEVLAVRPGDREALWEIRRSAHTFKGSAGIVGLKGASELAHRVEDLLERLFETDSVSYSDLLPLLRAAAGCLRALVAGDKSRELAVRLDTLYYDFDRAVKESSYNSNHPHPDGFARISTPTSAGEQAKDPTPKADRRPVVRVSLERLNRLVEDSRELNISRSRLDEELRQFGQRLEELEYAAERLQAASRWFEADQGGAGSAAGEVRLAAHDVLAVKSSLDTIRENLATIFEKHGLSIDQMGRNVQQTRMVEFGMLTPRLERIVRVTCEEEGKKADFVVENGHLEIDTQVLDALVEPLIHLLKNAVVHGIEPVETRLQVGKPETGRICVRLSNEGTHSIVTVSDDGRGISASVLKEKAVCLGLIDDATAAEITTDESIELIFRSGLTTAEKLNLSAGRGVGMSIVKESIEAGNGTIAVATTPQKGTTFTMRMPIPFASADAIDETGETLVLVVDDSPSTRHATARIVQDAGFAVETAEDGLDALEKLRSAHRLPAIILSDIEMPRMDGFEFATALRENRMFNHLPMIYITSRSGQAYRDKARATGAAAYLTKPCNSNELTQTLRKVLHR